MPVFKFPLVRCSSCDHSFNCQLPEDGQEHGSELVCLNCLIRSPEWATTNRLMAAVYYGLYPAVIQRIEVCIAAGHQALPTRECLDCHLGTLNVEVGIYYRTFNQVKEEYGLSDFELEQAIRRFTGKPPNILTAR